MELWIYASYTALVLSLYATINIITMNVSSRMFVSSSSGLGIRDGPAYVVQVLWHVQWSLSEHHIW